MRGAFYRQAMVLGLLVAVGAFAIDLYIPAFPAIARGLGTDAGTVQLSMTSYILALACGQVLYGPVSDAVGRKRPIFAGLALFIAGSVAAGFAPDIGLLIAARFLQGLGAAATAVIPMAAIRDEYTGPDAARLLSLAMLALSISPILAPACGGVLAALVGWRWIFGVLVVIAGLAALMVHLLLAETHPPQRRATLHPLSVLLTYARLLGARQFILPILIAGFAQVALFAFIAGSPFVFVTLHRVPPPLYGMLFALHAIALIGVSQFNAPMMRRFGTIRLVGGAAALTAAAGAALALLVCAGMSALWPFVALTLTIFAGLGMVMAPAFLAAMEPFGATAGAAAAIGAGLEFTMSSAATFAMSLAADGTARPMAVALALAGVLCLASWAGFALPQRAAASG